MGGSLSPVEKLRRLWSPGSEVEEVVHALDPQTALDSIARDFLHRICEQNGPQTLVLGRDSDLRMNTGSLRMEIVHFEPSPGEVGHREVTLWVEDADPNPPHVPGGVLDRLYPPNKITRGRRRR